MALIDDLLGLGFDVSQFKIFPMSLKLLVKLHKLGWKT